MFVRCEECNYENLAQHSFCGMCGARLPSPRRVPPPPPEPEPKPEPAALEPLPALLPVKAEATHTPQTMRGPSLLGLAVEPAQPERINYLLEDEPSGGKWRWWVTALVLVAGIAGAGWYWRTEVRGWMAGSLQNSIADTNPAPATTAAESVPANPTAASATPAPAAEGVAGSAATAPASVPPAQTPTPAVTAAAVQAAGNTPAPATDSAITRPVPPAAAPKAERKTPATDASTDALETQGENYLYGHGVEADCGRAGKSLLAAAARSNGKAESVLGTMYATGHCVTRDVPAAYRWFAKALHQDPGNVRIQRDLEVLWQQMTPEERGLATKAGP